MLGFHNGYVVEVGPQIGNGVLLRVVTDYNLDPDPMMINTEYLAKDASKVEPLITDMYRVGDYAKSKIGALEGRVVGFELHTNRVVCVSDKIHNYKDNRTRYAYKHHEIERYNPHAVMFEIGKWYKINSEKEVLAVESVFEDDEVMLFEFSGHIAYRHVPKDTCKHHLLDKYGIRSVQEMKKK